MSLRMERAVIFVTKDMTIEDMAIKNSTIMIHNEATLTLGPNSSVEKCMVYAPRESGKVAIYVLGPYAHCNETHLDTRP